MHFRYGVTAGSRDTRICEIELASVSRTSQALEEVFNALHGALDWSLHLHVALPAITSSNQCDRVKQAMLSHGPWPPRLDLRGYYS